MSNENTNNCEADANGPPTIPTAKPKPSRKAAKHPKDSANITPDVTAMPAPIAPASAAISNQGVNLLDLLDADAGTAPTVIEMVRLGTDETALIPFTPQAERVTLHYCSEVEISGYTRCNGSNCVLCKIGRRKDERLLIPVYLPAAGAVGVLPVSPALRPNALFPQLGAVIKAGKPMVVFVSRDRDKYTVSTAAIGPNVDAGETAIKTFLADYAAGRVALSSVISTYTDEQLAGVPAIGRMLQLKGVAA